MAQPTVRIHPPKRGDEEWLAGMIAPLLDMSSDLLAQGFAMGPISVGEGLDPEEADDLVDVLKGFGAEVDRIDGRQRAPAPRVPPTATQTQPFDGGHLRRMLAAAAPAPSAKPRAQTAVKPPTRRSVPSAAPPRRDSSPLASPSARPSAGPPPRVSLSLDPPRSTSPATLPGTPTAPARAAAKSRLVAGRGGPSVAPRPIVAGAPIASESISTLSSPGSARTEAGGDLRGTSSTSKAASPKTASPKASSKKASAPTRPSRRQPSPSKSATMSAGRPARSSNGPASINSPARSTGDLPPWFPQVPMRPDEGNQAQEKPDRSWIWFLLIMTLAGATAWYLQTRVD